MLPVLVLSTWPLNSHCDAFVEQLVQRKLAACVNIIPGVQSVFRWQGNLEKEQEQLLLIKTVESRLTALKAMFEEHHPYDVPELLVLPVKADDSPYMQWLTGSLSDHQAN